jgi:hypothetical protein
MSPLIVGFSGQRADAKSAAAYMRSTRPRFWFTTNQNLGQAVLADTDEQAATGQ